MSKMKKRYLRRGLEYCMEVDALGGEPYEYQMIQANKLNPLVPFQVEWVNQKEQLVYVFTGYRKWEDVLKEIWIDGRQLKEFVESVLEVVTMVKGYLLNPDNLVLETDCLFWDTGEHRLKFLYVPGYEINIRDQIRNFVECLMERVNRQDVEGVMLAWRIHLMLKEPEVDFKALEECFDKGEPKREEWKADEVNVEKSKIPKKRSLKGLWFYALIVMGLTGVLLAASEGYVLFHIYYYGIMEWKRNLLVVNSLLLLAVFLLTGFFFRKEMLHRQMESLFSEKRENVQEKDYSQMDKKKREIRQVFFSEETKMLWEPDHTPRLSFVEEESSDILILKYPFVLGKSPSDADYLLEYPQVSRIHARIGKRGNDYYIEDMSSTNGTCLNEVRLEKWKEYEIQNGDYIKIADIKFRFFA